MRCSPAVSVFQTFFIWAPAVFHISFLRMSPNWTSIRASPPMGVTESTVPWPKALCSTRSPVWNSTAAAFGADFPAGEALRAGEGLPGRPTPVPR